MKIKIELEIRSVERGIFPAQHKTAIFPLGLKSYVVTVFLNPNFN